MERGYFKVWRKIEDCRSWSRGLDYRGLMLTLLERANWKRGYFLGRELLPGQLACSGSGLAEELGVSRFRLLRMLSTLENDGFIARAGDGLCTWITILHWQTYQATAEASAQEAHSGRTGSAQEAHPIKEGKKARKDILSASADAGEGAALPAQDERQERPGEGERHGTDGEQDTEQERAPALTVTPLASTPLAESSLREPQEPRQDASPAYRTASRRLLKGRKLAWFHAVWNAFGYRRNKAEAADAFLCIEGLSDPLVERICAAARQEAARRPDLVARGKTPKLLMGWLQGRRWEDEDMSATPPVAAAPVAAPAASLAASPAPVTVDLPTLAQLEEGWKAGRALIEKWRRGERPESAGPFDRSKPFPIPGQAVPDAAQAGGGVRTACG